MELSLRELGRIVGLNFQVIYRLRKKGIFDLKPITFRGVIISPDAQAIVLAMIYKVSKIHFKRGTKKSLSLVRVLKEKIQEERQDAQIVVRFSLLEEYECVAYYEAIRDGEIWTLERFRMTKEDHREAEKNREEFNRFDGYTFYVSQFLFRIQALLLSYQDPKLLIQQIEKSLTAA